MAETVELEKKSREEEILAEINGDIDAAIDRMSPRELRRHIKRAAEIRKVAAARRAKLESDKARETARSSGAVRRA